MYHSNHKDKENHSKDKLYAALLALLQVKSYDAITIQSLTKKAGVSRSTFYRNYHRIDEILLQKIDSKMHAFSRYLYDYRAQYSGSLTAPFNLITPALEFWSSEYELIDSLIKIDRIHWLQFEFQQNSVLDNMDLFYLSDLSSKDVIYIQKIGFSIIFNTIRLWISSGRTETPQYLGDLILEHLFAIDPKTGIRK